VAVGFERWGKSLRWQHESGLRAAVLRTDRRYTWPFELTLVVGHTCLRDFEDRLPPHWSRGVPEYPVKARPSQATRLLVDFRYQPWNNWHCPRDQMADAIVEQQLEAIGQEVARCAPLLPKALTPGLLAEQIRNHGENAWCERRWIEDYLAFEAHTPA